MYMYTHTHTLARGLAVWLMLHIWTMKRRRGDLVERRLYVFVYLCM